MHLGRVCSAVAVAVVAVIVGSGHPAAALALGVSPSPSEIAPDVIGTATSPQSAGELPRASLEPTGVVVDTVVSVTEAGATAITDAVEPVPAAEAPAVAPVVEAVAPVIRTIATGVTGSAAPLTAVTPAVVPVTDAITLAVVPVADAITSAVVPVASEIVAPLPNPTVTATASSPDPVISTALVTRDPYPVPGPLAGMFPTQTAAESAFGQIPVAADHWPSLGTNDEATNAITSIGVTGLVPGETGSSFVAVASPTQPRSDATATASISPQRTSTVRAVLAVHTAATARVDRRHPERGVFWGWFGTFFGLTGVDLLRTVALAGAALLAGGAFVTWSRRRLGLRR